MEKEFIKRVLSSLLLFPIFLFFVIEGSYYFISIVLICFFLSLYEWGKMQINNNIKTLGIFFLIISFYTIFKIRTSFDNDYVIFLIIALICILSDLGGYIFGKLLKGPKLTKLSPKKTYAGMIGSYTLCILFYVFVANFKKFNVNNFISFFIFVIIISSISQLGDIVISYFKRLSKIKDTGNIIPGHGGLLDRIDGMLFAFPTSYLILMFDFFKIFI